MVRSNSGDWKMIFRTNLSTLNIGLMMYGRARWQDAEATRKDFNTVLIRQDNKSFTFELFKVIQDAIPLILHCKIMSWFRTISSSTFIILDVQSIYTPSQIQDWSREDNILASSRDKQTVLFTAGNPMHRNHQDPMELDLTKPRLASYKQKWKVHQDTVNWVDFQLAQRKGLKFYQTRSNAVILYDILPAYCISKAIVMKSEQVVYQKVYVSPRLPPTTSYKDNWMCDLDSDIARSSKDIQRIELKPNTQLSSTRRPVTKWKEETMERIKFDRDTLNQEKHDKVIDPTSMGRPVCRHECTKRCVLTPEHIDEDQTGTGRPALVDQKEEHIIDFRVSRLSHSVVKEAEHLRVQELVKKIEHHPHRAALQADSQHKNVYNPSSKNSKEMIRELRNVDLFGLCETTPKVQCSHCLLYWNQGIVYCTCGQCLIDSESRRKFNKLRLDALPIPNFVINKGPNHGARHGKTKEQTEYQMAWNAWKRCCKKVDSQSEHFTGIHDRFLTDPVFRESQLAIGWSEQKCKEWDEPAKEDNTYKLTPEERRRYRGQWHLTLNKEGKKTNTTRTRSFLRRLLLQRSSWPTYRMAKLAFNIKFLVVVRIQMELEVSSQFFCSNLSFLLKLVSFTVDSDPL